MSTEITNIIIIYCSISIPLPFQISQLKRDQHKVPSRTQTHQQEPTPEQDNQNCLQSQDPYHFHHFELFLQCFVFYISNTNGVEGLKLNIIRCSWLLSFTSLTVLTTMIEVEMMMRRGRKNPRVNRKMLQLLSKEELQDGAQLSK